MMSSSLTLATLALLSVNVSCLPGPDPGTYYFSKTVWTKEKEVPSYDLQLGDFEKSIGNNITLVGGGSNTEGNVLLNGKPICDDNWDDRDAKVVCRMMGFSSEGAFATTLSQFGPVSGDFTMDDVQCKGEETDINDCYHRDKHNCGAGEGAGVRCRVILFADELKEELEEIKDENEELQTKLSPVDNSGPLGQACPVCQPGWTLNFQNCRCYKFATTPASWTDANKECQKIEPSDTFTRGHLASVNNKQENDFLTSLTKGKHSWIGGFKFADQTWGWTDGQKWIETKDGGYTNWRFRDGKQVEPNNYGQRENSLLMNWAGRGLWNDAAYQDKYPYVCQYLSTSTEKGLLLTGGGIKEVELYNPVTKTSCALPALPETRTDHTQDGPLLCGGHANAYTEPRQTCMLLNSDDETWIQSHSLPRRRHYHVSWTPASGSGTYLLGGAGYTGGGDGYNGFTSDLVKPDGIVGKPFPLKHNTIGACSIQEEDRVVITGGQQSSKGTAVSVYDENGWIENLPNLKEGRQVHACTSFVSGGNKLMMVSGGKNYVSNEVTDTSEIWTGTEWRFTLGKLPYAARGVRMAFIDNRILLLGGQDSSLVSHKDILSFSLVSEEWTKEGDMLDGRNDYAISVVDLKDYKKWCR